LSNAINRKPLGFDYFRRLKKSWRRGRAIEYALIALLIAFTAFQVVLAVGANAI
jgi:Flp pilus assembly pilin Flp